jgi:hypothetical protein
LYDFSEQGHYGPILYLASEKFEKYLVIDAVEELLDIALKRETRPSVVLAHRSHGMFQPPYALVRPLSQSARERRRNEHWLEDIVENTEQRMVDDAISDRRFMDPPPFWVAYPEARVRSVAVCFVRKLAAELEDILLNLHAEFQHVFFVLFVPLEYLPRNEKVFGGDD